MMIKTVWCLLFLAHLHQVCGQQPLECTTTCNKGEYCKEDECFQCQYGFFMELSDHKERSCRKWSYNPGRNVAIIKNGSSTEDIVWGCKDGYEKKYTLVDGFECLEIKIDLSTEKSSTTTHMTTSTDVANTTTLTQSPQKEAKKPDILKIILSAVLVPVLIILVAVLPTIIVCYRKRRNRREQTVTESELFIPLTSENNSNESNLVTLNRIFHKIVQVIGIQECKKLFWHIEDQSKTFGRKPTLNNDSACYLEFQKWHSLNPHINHIKCLIEALSKLEYNFPADIRDLNDFLASLEFHEKLNDEFKKFCLELCKLFGPSDIDSLVNILQLKEQYTSRRRENKDVKTAFQECLAKWSYKHPYIANENNEWSPLTEIQEALKRSDRNDVIEDLPKLLEGIHGVIIGIEVGSENNEPSSNGLLV